MANNPCGTCEQPTAPGMLLCHRDTERLEQDLAEVDSVIDALWASITRRDVGTGTVGSSGHSTPSDPSNGRAYDAARALNTVLSRWSMALGHPRRDAVKASNVLFSRIREVRQMDWAPHLQLQLREALTECRRAMDRPGRRTFAGMCPMVIDGEECGTPVYAPEEKPEARCETCRAVWDVSEWRGRAITAAGFHAGTPVELSRMLSDPITGETLPQGKISVWVNRGHLAPIATNAKGRAVYEVRKVRNLWTRSKAGQPLAIRARRAKGKTA